MNLNDLLSEAVGDLQPGEKRIRPDLQVRNFHRINDRINELERALYRSDDLQIMLQRDPEIFRKLESVKDKIRRKIELLTRAKSRPMPSQQKMWQLLETECSDFIPIMKAAQKVIYRGVKNEESVFEGRSREDRTPKDSNREVSAAFDQALIELGVRALRSNSIYTTSRESFASNYGWNVYIVFPKNGFDFLGTSIRDLVLENWNQLADMEAAKNLLRELNTWGQDNVSDWTSTDIHHSIRYQEWQWAFDQIRQNFESGNPMNIPQQYNKSLKDFVSAESVRKNFDPNTTDLERAIDNGKELLIRGEYWALKRSDWLDAVNQHFFAGNLQN